MGIGMGVRLGGSCVEGRGAPGEADLLEAGAGWDAEGTDLVLAGVFLVAEDLTLDAPLACGGRGIGVSFRPACPAGDSS